MVLLPAVGGGATARGSVCRGVRLYPLLTTLLGSSWAPPTVPAGLLQGWMVWQLEDYSHCLDMLRMDIIIKGLG